MPCFSKIEKMNLNLFLAPLGNTSTLIWNRIQHGIFICFEETDDYGKLDITILAHLDIFIVFFNDKFNWN
jgi:hypothetical protein